jgi:GT2 family glycosyltransferase
MKLSVILIGYNSWHFLGTCLSSLFRANIRLENEILYVDNGSADGSVAKVKKLYPEVKIIANDRNRGVSAARNQGLKAASGEYLLLLDSDTEVPPDALESMADFMDTHPEAGLCGCKTFGPKGIIHDSCRPFPTPEEKLAAGLRILSKKLHLRTTEPPASYDKNAAEPFEVDYVLGACQMIRREAQQKTGELDEHIFYGPEDADYCLRMHQAGYKVYFLPQTAIYHAYQRTSSQKVFSKLNMKHIQGLLYYFRKHGGRNNGKAAQ